MGGMVMDSLKKITGGLWGWRHLSRVSIDFAFLGPYILGGIWIYFSASRRRSTLRALRAAHAFLPLEDDAPWSSSMRLFSSTSSSESFVLTSTVYSSPNGSSSSLGSWIARPLPLFKAEGWAGGDADVDAELDTELDCRSEGLLGGRLYDCCRSSMLILIFWLGGVGKGTICLQKQGMVT